MYICKNCGYSSAMKLGKCPECGEFGTFINEKTKSERNKNSLNKRKKETYSKGENLLEKSKNLQLLDNIISGKKIDKNFLYYDIESEEIKRILINGIKRGGVYLIGGEPGIGKSTIALKLINELLLKNKNIKIVYFSGEELEEQIIERLVRTYPKLKEFIKKGQLSIINTNSLEDIVNTINENELDFVIIDSIQTIESSEIDGVAGGPAQVKYCSDVLTTILKKNKTSGLIIGHMTKGGEVAGPRYLEHIVDVVLYFEGDRYGNYRFLRAKKNRFGPTDEMGIFEMTEKGLQEVENYSSIIIENSNGVLGCALDNGRPIIVPIESIISPMQYNYPKKTIIGIKDFNRVDLILNIINNYLKIKLLDKDIFINIPGENIKYNDNGLDLAIAASLLYKAKGKKYDGKYVFVGEINLSGKILKTKLHEKRVKTIKQMGYEVIDYTKIKDINELVNFI